ncbi:NEL-type E3 ubiquitin ligase domain-containing protein [Pseudomonas sp. S36]|uniref:NEL-type E3 ubiquitin ligase domain-containing protein n=1 Tax=Pseudomonas sp. S36 TaxID=2767447 RepID=UPI00191492B8|nr:NEL-type E3 ubiquitin ligase domain-containing protein [Pseudomonas sp. S36]MBK4990471.1 hypothetical protein [Pseudomonas sp. S36]
MTDSATPPLSTAQRNAKMARAAHDFIGARLPAWLKQASPAQINRLRDRFKAHHASQAHVRSATRRLIPLQSFAQLHMQRLVEGLPGSPGLEKLQWLEIRRRFAVPPGVALPVQAVIEWREPAVLRLMQNFEDKASFYQGSGLVMEGESTPLSGDTEALVLACRRLDAGELYQRLLTQVFTEQTCEALAQDKRAALSLATEIAALRGDLTAPQQLALAHIASSDAGSLDLHGYPGLFSVLGHTLADALLIQLRDARGNDQGLVLYLPSDPTQALRYFTSAARMNAVLADALREPGYRSYLSQLVAVQDRAAFLQLLGKRLADPVPDLALEGVPQVGDIFSMLVTQQVQRVKDDARLLLVPTSLVDQQASARLREQWVSVGLGLANLAGLFIPLVGAMLLGQLVVQTLVEVFEGAADWYHGHQHEALEHMLGVAETLAVTAAVAAGVNITARGFAASEFVEGLEPVVLGDGRKRLWANDLKPYALTPEYPQLSADGLYRDQGHRLLRVGQHYYPVHRPQGDGPWRVCHPRRPGGYGPSIEAFGSRSWRLTDTRPLEQPNPRELLNSLWPLHSPLDETDASRVLRAAGVDMDELRGLQVECRDTPANLHDTLLRFSADRRIGNFFAGLQAGSIPRDDAQVLAWCINERGISLEADARDELLAAAPRLRRRLFDHLCRQEADGDPLLAVMAQDLPGLPVTYAKALAHEMGAAERQLALAEGKLPLHSLRQGAALLRVARLNRAVCGLYLDHAYCDEAGELVFALLARQEGWPPRYLELWSMDDPGRRIAALGERKGNAAVLRVVHRDGLFQLREEAAPGYGALVHESGSLFECLVAVLTPAQSEGLGLAGIQPVTALRKQLIKHLPASHDGIARVLGWAPQARWFNPGRRMPDGRVGYPLSGRLPRYPSPQRVLRERLRNLYPGLDDTQIDEQLNRLLEGQRSVYDALLELEEDFADLERHLNRWASFEFDPARQAVRQQVVARLRRAWRLQGEPWGNDGQGQRLSLINLNLASLPELPGHIDFPQIRALVIRDVPITHVPTDFLRAFSGLRELTLSNNRLLQVPVGLAYLVELRSLRLGHNRIRLNRNALDVMNGLPHLRSLDLSYNPLGAFHVRYNQLPHLVELNLRHCQLGEWPSGLELCAGLERADLRDNQLGLVPQAILAMPHVQRLGLLVDRNRLSMADIQQLFALDTIAEHFHLPEARRAIEPTATRQLWLDAIDLQQTPGRQALWDRVMAMPRSGGLLRVLSRLQDTGDYQQASFYLGERVWSVLEAIDGNAQLRQRVFSLAELPLTCANTVADRFCELQLRVLAEAAEHYTLPDRSNDLLMLGQQLFRLERLEQVVRRDILQRLAAREWVDQIALSLQYRVRLRVRLNLPCQPRAMRYEEAANVTQAQLDQACQEVLSAQPPDALAVSLAQRAFWERCMETLHPQAFASLDISLAARRAALAARQGELPADQYQLEWDDLEIEHAGNRQMLVQELTRQLLLGRERGLG